MRVLLTPSELADAISASTRDNNGMVELEFPDDAVAPRDDRPILADPQLVRYGDRQVKLTPTEHAIVRFVLEHGPSEVEAVIDAVWWRKEITDKCVRSHASRVTCQFFDAGIPFELTTRGGFVSIQRTDGD